MTTPSRRLRFGLRKRQELVGHIGCSDDREFGTEEDRDGLRARAIERRTRVAGDVQTSRRSPSRATIA
jgi:hypothetical protein